MTSPIKAPALAGDFGLVSTADRLMWRDALARHVLKPFGLPDWKVQEQLEPMNSTIACLMNQGVTEPAAISKYVFEMGSVRT